MIIATLTALFSCDGSGDAPDGMQLVRGGEDVGYYFYAPEEWTVANNGEISAAYASKIDVTSVTLVPTKAPMSDIESYFENALTEFTFALTNEPSISECDFGNADKAHKAIYEFEYEKHPMRTMQIFAEYGDRFYIFTFTAQLAERSEGKSYYDFYLDKLQSIIDNVRFTDKTDTPNAENYEKDSDGYLLVSDESICGYELYIHPDWQVRYAQTNISIITDGGANANITEATSVGVSRDEYWENRKRELSSFVTNLNVISEGVETTLGNSTWAFAYEYTYEYGGGTYHVYQIIAVAGAWPIQDGYVFTYTSPESEYTNHLEEFIKMSEKVNFK